MDRAPSIDAIREHLLRALRDCDGADAERMRIRVRRAATAEDLWHARSDLFQVIARRHCESHAKLILGVTAGHLASSVENI